MKGWRTVVRRCEHMSHDTCPDQYLAPAAAEERELLVVVHSPSLRLLCEQFEFPSSELVVGRDSTCDLVLDVQDVSRRHACIRERAGRHFVHDLGSRNGTYVNARRVTACELAPGSLLRVGSVVMKYLSGNDPEAMCCARMKQLADADTLTGLAVRRVFADALSRELARSRRHGHPLSLALIDIDRFKDVNDHFGHLLGDAVLVQVASSINALVRREQLLARIGGDELALLLPDVPMAKASAFAEKIRKLIEGRVFGNQECRIGATVSIGVAELRDTDVHPDALLARADTQLYGAKCAGRNRVYPAVIDPSRLPLTLRNRAEVCFRRESASEAVADAEGSRRAFRAAGIDHES